MYAEVSLTHKVVENPLSCYLVTFADGVQWRLIAQARGAATLLAQELRPGVGVVNATRDGLWYDD